MSTLVKAKIVKIGNSQGIRIPKLLLDQAELGEEVELEVQDGRIIIRSIHAPRSGWKEQFKTMAAHGDDILLDDELLDLESDEDEWEW